MNHWRGGVTFLDHPRHVDVAEGRVMIEKANL